MALGILPALFLLVPLSTLTFVAFALQLPVAPILVLLIFWGLGVPILYSLDYNLSPGAIPVLPLLLVLAGGLLTVGAVYTEKQENTQPLHSEVGYYLDADQKKAYWATTFATTDHWNKQFFPNPVAGLTPTR